MYRHQQPETLHSLQDILAAEIDVCASLIETSETIRKALVDRRSEILRRTITTRDSLIGELIKLEERAVCLRGEAPPLPPHLDSDRRKLLSLARQAVLAEDSLRQLSRKTIESMQQDLKGLQARRKVLYGYLGTRTTEPRFADRRG